MAAGRITNERVSALLALGQSVWTGANRAFRWAIICNVWCKCWVISIIHDTNTSCWGGVYYTLITIIDIRAKASKALVMTLITRKWKICWKISRFAGANSSSGQGILHSCCALISRISRTLKTFIMTWVTFKCQISRIMLRMAQARFI
jgi:hypothetical protein